MTQNYIIIINILVQLLKTRQDYGEKVLLSSNYGDKVF